MPQWPHSDPEVRRSIRMLFMVLELHKQGYQRIRISPGLGRSNNRWQCAVTHAANIQKTHGALLEMNPEDDHIAYYTTEASNQYFGWNDAKTDNPRQLAEKFVQRFPIIVALGRGRDWEYIGWFVSMLGVAESGCLPVAYDKVGMQPIVGKLATTSVTGTRIFLPMPPVVRP